MRLLFDQGTPSPLRTYLSDHVVATAFEQGWSNLENGELLNAAEAEGFDALITTDQNLLHQQNLSQRKISVVVLLTTNWPRIARNVSLVIEAVQKLPDNKYQEISFPET